jgi:CRP/FNR family cyclic AMP-dependent transcriptional regulator
MRSRIPQSEIDHLSRVPLFSRCKKTELREIARFGTPISVPEGRELTREGAIGREFFLVLNGTATCTIRGKEVARIVEGDFFGELALLEGGIRTATVTALTPMRLLVLDSGEFKDIISAHPTIAANMMSALASRIRDADGLAADLVGSSPKGSGSSSRR